MNTQALYAGSFDPFTIGHWSVVDRALRIFDRVIIAIGENADKNAFWPLEKRLDHIRSVYKDNARVGVISYSGLTADTAAPQDAPICCEEYARLSILNTNAHLPTPTATFPVSKPFYYTRSPNMRSSARHWSGT